MDTQCSQVLSGIEYDTHTHKSLCISIDKEGKKTIFGDTEIDNVHMQRTFSRVFFRTCTSRCIGFFAVSLGFI